jgi:hypothetical protein
MSYPFHMRRRRRSGGGLSFAQRERMRAERKIRLLAILSETIPAYLKLCGEAGANDIEALVCRSWEELADEPQLVDEDQ